MLTSKQRAFLRGLASTKNTLMQIGKGGITENVVAEINQLLEANEIVKIHCLENTLVDAKDVLDAITEVIPDCEPVASIGRRVVIYRESKQNKQIDLNKLCVVPKQEKSKKAPAKKTASKEKPKKTVKPGYKKQAKQKSFADTKGSPRGSRGGFGRNSSHKTK